MANEPAVHVADWLGNQIARGTRVIWKSSTGPSVWKVGVVQRVVPPGKYDPATRFTLVIRWELESWVYGNSRSQVHNVLPENVTVWPVDHPPRPAGSAQPFSPEVS